MGGCDLDQDYKRIVFFQTTAGTWPGCCAIYLLSMRSISPPYIAILAQATPPLIPILPDKDEGY